MTTLGELPLSFGLLAAVSLVDIGNHNLAPKQTGTTH